VIETSPRQSSARWPDQNESSWWAGTTADACLWAEGIAGLDGAHRQPASVEASVRTVASGGAHASVRVSARVAGKLQAMSSGPVSRSSRSLMVLEPFAQALVHLRVVQQREVVGGADVVAVFGLEWDPAGAAASGGAGSQNEDVA